MEYIQRVSWATAASIGINGLARDEFVEDCLSRCWIALHAYDGRVPVKNYLQRVIQNFARTNLRAAGRTGRRFTPLDETIDIEVRVDIVAVVEIPMLLMRMSPQQQEAVQQIAADQFLEDESYAVRRSRKAEVRQAAQRVFRDYRCSESEGEESE